MLQVLVSSMLVCLLAISSYGVYLLQTDSDLSWFLKADSYLKRFMNNRERFFDDGTVAKLYTGERIGLKIGDCACT